VAPFGFGFSFGNQIEWAETDRRRRGGRIAGKITGRLNIKLEVQATGSRFLLWQLSRLSLIGLQLLPTLVFHYPALCTASSPLLYSGQSSIAAAQLWGGRKLEKLIQINFCPSRTSVRRSHHCVANQLCSRETVWPPSSATFHQKCSFPAGEPLEP